ncbi:MAG: 50S ribosomal protein L35 [Planctomycetota bacterium]|nr:50S ribosomal protein L35 [Planctomycetota bacterium]
MPKSKSHKGLLKRIKITKSGKIRFRSPNSRHIKSNKTGDQVRGYRRPRYSRAGDMKRYSMLLFRPLRSQEQSKADEMARESASSTEA